MIWKLRNGLVDQLKLKLNPILIGEGIPLFGDSKTKAKWHLTEREHFTDGMQIITYDLQR